MSIKYEVDRPNSLGENFQKPRKCTNARTEGRKDTHYKEDQGENSVPLRCPTGQGTKSNKSSQNVNLSKWQTTFPSTNVGLSNQLLLGMCESKRLPCLLGVNNVKNIKKKNSTQRRAQKNTYLRTSSKIAKIIYFWHRWICLWVEAPSVQRPLFDASKTVFAQICCSIRKELTEYETQDFKGQIANEELEITSSDFLWTVPKWNVFHKVSS